MIVNISYTIHKQPKHINGETTFRDVDVTINNCDNKQAFYTILESLPDVQNLPHHLPEFGITVTKVEDSEK